MEYRGSRRKNLPTEFRHLDPGDDKFRKSRGSSINSISDLPFPVAVIALFLLVGALQLAYKYGGQDEIMDGTLENNSLENVQLLGKTSEQRYHAPEAPEKVREEAKEGAQPRRALLDTLRQEGKERIEPEETIRKDTTKKKPKHSAKLHGKSRIKHGKHKHRGDNGRRKLLKQKRQHLNLGSKQSLFRLKDRLAKHKSDDNIFPSQPQIKKATEQPKVITQKVTAPQIITLADILGKGKPRNNAEALRIFYMKHDKSKVKNVPKYLENFPISKLKELLGKKYGELPDFLEAERTGREPKANEATTEHHEQADIFNRKPRNNAEALRIFYMKHDKSKVKNVPKYLENFPISKLKELLGKKYGAMPDFLEAERTGREPKANADKLVPRHYASKAFVENLKRFTHRRGALGSSNQLSQKRMTLEEAIRLCLVGAEEVFKAEEALGLSGCRGFTFELENENPPDGDTVATFDFKSQTTEFTAADELQPEGMNWHTFSLS
jgi:hypothetical protein